MKKLFLLPLAALACLACSKTDLTADQDAPGLQQNEAVQQSFPVTFNNRVPSHMTNETTVTYTAPDGSRQTLRPTGLTNPIDVAPNSSVEVNIVVVNNSGEDIQGSLYTNTGFYRELNSPNPLTGNFSFSTTEAAERLEITLQVD